ncbi:MAG: adenylate/guanylate cyclase domain-containing protein [Abditibacteriales bacterium]|nr:adenylate/guanylate cyclase domain-containing protein [Abditibacteriales bacterium]MDW8366531.1 adenylate/guanylate cyclase domain-containing protein [Abditibacteriales bacterium]
MARLGQRGKRLGIAMILALVVALGVTPLYRGFEQRLISTEEPGFVAALLESLELKSYDARMQQAARQWRRELTARRKVHHPDDPNLSPVPEIVILAIDEDSLDPENVGEWPWSRDVYAKVVRKLKRAGAKAILFDLDLGRTKNPRADADFAQAMKEAGNVVLAALVKTTQDLQRDRQSRSRITHLSTVTPKLPPEVFEMACLAVGLTNVEKDADGIVRRVQLAWEHSMGYVYPALGIYGAAILKGIPPAKLEEDLATFHPEDRHLHPALRRTRVPQFDGTPVPTLPVKEGEEEIPGKKGQRYMMRHHTVLPMFVGPYGTFAYYPFHLVYRDRAHSGETLWTDDDLQARFGGKIVLIGATVLSFQDIHPTPFGDMPGVEIWANVATAVRDKHLIKTAPTWGNVLSIFALAFLASVLSILWHPPASHLATLIDLKTTFFVGKRKVRLLPYGLTWCLLYGGCGAVPPLAVHFYLTSYLLRPPHLTWLTFVYPAVASVLTYAAGVIHILLTEQQERRKVATRFGKIVSPSVFRDLMDHPEDAPKPRRVTATLLFTDLQGFTTLSETRDPSEVVEVLNAYLDRMVSVIFKYEGTIDKFIGDAIMAVFGAPKAYPDHARRAVLAAIEMQEELIKFREEGRQKGWPDFFMRIGINTDDFMMGLIGANELMNYTCIGDGVNLGARLEGKNKDFGSWIMCSHATYKEVADLVIAEHKGTVAVKGKQEGVDVYVIRGLRSVGPRDHLWGEGAHASPSIEGSQATNEMSQLVH